MRKGHFQKVKEHIKAGTIDERHLSGPCVTYTLPREEIEKRWGKVEPQKKRFCNGWPTAGQPNQRHIGRKGFKDVEPFEEVDYMDPAWGLEDIMMVFGDIKT